MVVRLSEQAEKMACFACGGKSVDTRERAGGAGRVEESAQERKVKI